METATTAEKARAQAVELIAAGRIQDAIDAVSEYLKVYSHPNHLTNKIKKLERLGVICGSTFITLDGERYRGDSASERSAS